MIFKSGNLAILSALKIPNPSLAAEVYFFVIFVFIVVPQDVHQARDALATLLRGLTLT